MGNPDYNQTLRPGGLGRQTRSLFEGTTARVFPLKANINVLRTFCDAYLNIAPDIAHFRPTLPYVLLMVLDYGKMAAETANAGWVSQHEVAFAVPLEWYDTRDGRENPRFVDFAAVCPFIYVDDEISLAMGRRVYGWPKVKVWISAEQNPWVDDPVAAQHLLSLSTMVYPELYKGVKQEPTVFLEIHRDVLPIYTPFPPDPSHPSNPFGLIPQALKGYMSLVGSALEIFTRAPQLGYEAGSPLAPLLSLQRMASWGASALYQNVALNSVTLKQFRDSEEPDYICYQALVNSQIRVQRWNASGILGESNQLMGDPTGGFSIGLRRYAAQPIIESLGLEVAAEVEVEGVGAAVLRPLLPFWMDVDLEYGPGENLAWRTKGSDWHCGDRPDCAKSEGKTYFNTARGAALQGVTGPFDFPNTTVRVLPLLADRKQLKRLCEDYLCNEIFDFEPWGRHVYVAIANYEEMSSATNNIGWWADRDMNFYVPVRVRRHDDESLISVGMVPMFSFTNTSTAAITGAEVLGLPSVRTTLNSPPDVWMDERGPAAQVDQPILVCKTQVLPALHMGQEVEFGTLLEATRADVLPHSDPAWSHIAEDWGYELLEDHQRMVAAKQKHPEEFTAALALALEILARDQPVNLISLKQFGDAENAAKACYQSIVRLRQVFEHVYEIREMDHRIHLHIHRQPTQPIVEKLGLVVKWTETGGAVPVDVLQPTRPFWMRVALRSELGTRLCWRSGSEQWQHGNEADRRPPEKRMKRRGYFEELQKKPKRWKSGVGRGLVEWADQGQKSFGSLGQEWARKKDARNLGYREARDAVETVEPQMVLESMLSRNWGRTEPPDKPDFRIRTDSVGPHPKKIFKEGRYFDPWYSEDEPEPPKLEGRKKDRR